MKRLLLILATGVISTGHLPADDSSSTPPVGYAKLTIHEKTDNPLAVPLVRDVDAYGTIAAFNPTSITIANGQWAPGQFVRDAVSQVDTFEVEFVTGALKGMTYKILSNTQDTLVIDTQGDDLTAHRRGVIAPGDLIAIRPYWTLGDVLGSDDTSVVLSHFDTAPSPDQIESGDCVLFPDVASIGIEKNFSLALAYVRQIGWRAAGDASDDQGATLLPMGTVFIVHRQDSGNTEAVVIGDAPRNPFITPVKGGNGTLGNDSYIALTQADPVSLDASALTTFPSTNNVVQPSTSLTLRDDELLAFSSTRSGFHRAPDLTFYEVDGHWKKLGSTSATIGQDFQLQPGVGYLLRKRPANGNQDWIQVP